jgi:hypothetical protein
MHKYILIPIFFLFIAQYSVIAQPLLSSSTEIGYFFYHSDNQLHITENKDFTFIYGLDVSLRFKFLNTDDIQISVGYFNASITESQRVPQYYLGSDLGYTHANLSQTSIPLDITYFFTEVSPVDIGMGVSAVGTNREMTLSRGFFKTEYVDKFNSFGLGPNLIIQFTTQVMGSNNLMFVSNAKLRYITTVWFDKNGRDLSSYKLNSVQGFLSLGLGWKF